MNNKLTIAIPTFNRQGKAQELFKKINKKHNYHEFDLIIADNSSEPPIAIDGSNKYNKIFSRKFNIGFTANILRLFEECETEWLIILGDDDDINDTFLNDIELSITGCELDDDEVCAIKFKSSLDKHQEIIKIQGFDQFCTYNSTPERMGSTIFLSTWLFRVSSLRNYIRYGYMHSGLQIPHVIPVLKALNDGHAILYSDLEPVLYRTADENSRWDPGFTFVMGFFSTFTFPEFIKNNQLLNFTKLMGGQKLKSMIGFTIKIYYTFPEGNLKYLLRFYSMVGVKQFTAVIIFKLIKPFLKNKSISLKLKKIIGITSNDRM